MANLAILLPIYEADSRHLRASIASLIIGAPEDSEVVIGLDGPCSDINIKVIEKAQELRPSLKLTILGLKRQGLANTLNQMIERSDSKWIARQDADDYSIPTRFTRQINALEQRPDYCFCGTQITRCDENLRPRDRQRHYPTRFISQWAYASCLNNPIAHPTLLINRQQLGDLRYQNIKGVEDWQLFADLWKRGLKSFNLQSVELFYRMHPKQITSDKRTWSEVKRLKRESLEAAMPKHPARLAIRILHNASNALHLSEALIARRKIF